MYTLYAMGTQGVTITKGTVIRCRAALTQAMQDGVISAYLYDESGKLMLLNFKEGEHERIGRELIDAQKEIVRNLPINK